MIRARVMLAVFSFLLVTALSGCEQTSPAASSQTPPENLDRQFLVGTPTG